MPPSANLPDDALPALLARGDEDALAELYDRFGGVAYRLAYRVLRDQALAEDAVQEAFLAAWRTAVSFDPARGKASTWLLTLVHCGQSTSFAVRSAAAATRSTRRRSPQRMRPTRPPRYGSSGGPCRRRWHSSRTSSGRRSSSPTTAG